MPVDPQPPPEEPLWRTRDGLKYLSPQRARAFLGLVRAGQRILTDLDEELRRRHGLSVHAFEVLLHLAVFTPKRRARMATLAQRLPLSQSRVSRLIAELERDALLQRSSAEDDRRGVVVELTPRGVDTFIEAQETALTELDRTMFSKLTWDDVLQLADITERLLDDEPT